MSACLAGRSHAWLGAQCRIDTWHVLRFQPLRLQPTMLCSERKNVNLPGVNVDLPTLTDKDIDDLVNWVSGCVAQNTNWPGLGGC